MSEGIEVTEAMVEAAGKERDRFFESVGATEQPKSVYWARIYRAMKAAETAPVHEPPKKRPDQMSKRELFLWATRSDAELQKALFKIEQLERECGRRMEARG